MRSGSAYACGDAPGFVRHHRRLVQVLCVVEVNLYQHLSRSRTT